MTGDSVSTSIFVLPFPEPKSAQEGIGVIAHTATGRQLFQFFGIPSSKNNVIGFEGAAQSGHHIRDPVRRQNPREL